MNKRYKPHPKYKIFAAKWYNPIFWISVLLVIPISIIVGAFNGVLGGIEWYKDALKNYDIR